MYICLSFAYNLLISTYLPIYLYIRVVLHDVRMARPLGRWVELARLALIRKEYAFLYSKLLKVRDTTTYCLLPNSLLCNIM